MSKNYNSIADLLSACREEQKEIWQIVLENECRLREISEEEVWSALRVRLQVMRNSVTKALDTPQHMVGGLISGYSKQQEDYGKTGNTLCGTFLNHVMAMALSGSEVNASMGLICAAPTAGSCGILPAVLLGMEQEFGLSEETVLRGLLTASGIGAVITRNATVAGAEGGCQAECGAAAAMAAAAAVQMRGGSPEQCAQAVSLALSNCMGLVCDPIAGLVQVPCAQRNASQSVNALLCADLALAGIGIPVASDQVVDAMSRVGRSLPKECRETALGGIAAEPDAQAITREISGS